MSQPKSLVQQTMVLPLLKLGTLALRTICKPIANRLKKEAGVHPRFRQFIINIAQANHRFTTKLQRRASGRVTDAVIRPLNEERAVQAAADLLGELFAFTVAGAALVYEVQRNARGEAKKEEKRQQELAEIRQKHEKMEKEIEEMKQRCSLLQEELSKPLNVQVSKPLNEEVPKPRGLAWLFNYMCWQSTTDQKIPVAELKTS
ncbi:PREDICTED: OPA3-like protein [Camelina sativa]|uniref:OPA3-like protein n=1 Tax=Camelina sativa TaxID=90675 RepID=A0ABM0TKG9_CAMSA|nr:PREDICTED: OPA3-like protein [Camelina sativa]